MDILDTLNLAMKTFGKESDEFQSILTGKYINSINGTNYEPASEYKCLVSIMGFNIMNLKVLEKI